MDYITPAEAAKKWEINLRTVQQYCVNDRIPGAVRIGRQWFIPMDAQRPTDGRRIDRESAVELEPYHFPYLIVSRFYAYPSALNDEERKLLEAQKLNICGKLAESIKLCRELLNESLNPIIKFGANLTNASNYFVLGCTPEFSAYVKAMEAICEQVSTHREDLRLLLDYISYNASFTTGAYEKIDVSKLSSDALTAYECFILQKSAFDPTPLNPAFKPLFSAFCKQLENLGIAPLLFAIHGILASFATRDGDKEGQREHIAIACRIAYENGFMRLLSKYSVIAPDEYRKIMLKYSVDFANSLEKIRKINIKKIARFRSSIKNDPRVVENVDVLSDFAWLLSLNLSNKDIAIIKNLSEREVRNMIQVQCEKFNLSTKKELVELYNDLLYPRLDS